MSGREDPCEREGLPTIMKDELRGGIKMVKAVNLKMWMRTERGKKI